MKRKVYLLFVLLSASTTLVFAQTRGSKKISVGPEMALPQTGLTDRFNVGFGGSIIYQAAVADHLYFTGSVGFVNFKSKATMLGSNFFYKLHYVPLKAGIKYFVMPNIYASGELGASFQNGNGSNTIYFAYSPGIGTEFPISANNSIDIGLRYEGWAGGKASRYTAGGGFAYFPGNVSFIGLRAAYNFSL